MRSRRWRRGAGEDGEEMCGGRSLRRGEVFRRGGREEVEERCGEEEVERRSSRR